MSRFGKTHARNVLAVTCTTLLGASLVGGLWKATHPQLPTMTLLTEAAPAAAGLLHSTESFRPLPEGRFAVTTTAGRYGKDVHKLEVTLPRDTSSPIQIGPNAQGDALSLVGARRTAATMERGSVVYERAYEDVDVVAAATDDHFELGYVLRSPKAKPDLHLRLALGSSDVLRIEPSTGAVLLQQKGQSPRLRLGAPVVVDAKGQRRAGTYKIAGDEVAMQLPVTGLSYPLVVDPSLAFPVWTVLSDARGPGGVLYSASALSMETHYADDTGRNVAVAVRPVRSKQVTDSGFLSGTPFGIDPSLAPTPTTTPAPGALESAEWQRGYAFGSETWEWSQGSWTLNEAARLPGLIDPTLGYDPVRGRVVLYGGAPPSFSCNPTAPWGLVFCAISSRLDLTYEYVQGNWVAKEIPSSPPPRLRAAMAFDATTNRLIMFGGRTLDAEVAGSPGSLFPEGFTGSLLADTWAYDGTSWARIPTQSPPPPVEGAQLVQDPVRNVLVLVGGHTDVDPGGSDPLRVWEFDGVDWSQRVAPGTATLPVSLQNRHGANAFWNPILRRVVVEGGSASVLDLCPLSPTQIATRVAAIGADPTAMKTFAQSGCLGGYTHDSWTWDGTAFTRIGDVAFGGFVGSQAVFQQIAGDPSWATTGVAPPSATAPVAPPSGLLPWRYDSNPAHFALRSTLERGYVGDPGLPAPSEEDAGYPDDAGAGSSTPPTFVSPLFAAAVHGHVFFDTANAEAHLFFSDSADLGSNPYQALNFNGAVWAGDGPATPTPFEDGTNEFFAAAWDSSNQRIVLFDPRTGITSTYTDAGGWAPISGAPALPVWSLDPRAHVLLQALSIPQPALAPSVLIQIPQMTFDRVRGTALMTYRGSLYQLGSSGWTSTPLPPSMTNCTAALQLEFDGTHGQSVLVGCTVPAQTWMFDGTNWTGPGPSPFVAKLGRGTNNFIQCAWTGTVQLPWAHPNSIFDSPSLGGASLIDADGTVTTWNGQAWTPGPAMSGGTSCVAQLANPLGQLNGSGGNPGCLSPPVIEDTAFNRIVAFRGGPVGLERLRTSGLPMAQQTWSPLEIGYDSILQRPPSSEIGPGALGGLDIQVNPYPFELESAEVAFFQTESDPASRTLGVCGANEDFVANLFWPFRVLRDPGSGMVRVLTHRGMVWQLGGEPVSAPGETCQTNSDCADGWCTTGEHVCCSTPYCGAPYACTTCAGATPGTCSTVAAGHPDPTGVCGSGSCAGTCSGSSVLLSYEVPACSFDGTRACAPAPSSCANGLLTTYAGTCSATSASCTGASSTMPCPGGLACASATSCLTAAPDAGVANGLGGCTSRLNCVSPYDTCNISTGTCSPDSASQAASTLGVTPVSWTPPQYPTPTQIVAALEDAGYAPDDSGVIALPIATPYGLSLGYDPNLRNSFTSMHLCVEYINLCALLNGSRDSCVASAPRCPTGTPWIDQPVNQPCCAEQCLYTYLSSRASMSPIASVHEMLASGCFDPALSDGGLYNPDAE